MDKWVKRENEPLISRLISIGMLLKKLIYIHVALILQTAKTATCKQGVIIAVSHNCHDLFS